MKFDDYLANSEEYMTEIRVQGDLPWFENPHRRAKIAAQLGLPADTPPLEVRKALFEAGRR